MTLTLYTYDWLPEFPRGFVRDLRVRWLLEELGRPYTVATVRAHPKTDAHLAMHPFAQVPILCDGDLTLFESGAILLHLASGTALLPDHTRAEGTQWLLAALNTVESASGHWMRLVLAQQMPKWFGPAPGADLLDHARKGMNDRLAQMEYVLSGRDWLVGDFSVADIMMADVLRVPQNENALISYPALTAYVAQATTRPAFRRAHADHMAHWQAGDAAKAKATA